MKLAITMILAIIAGYAFAEDNVIGGMFFTVAAVACAFSTIGTRGHDDE